jgi:hypothetical protein
VPGGSCWLQSEFRTYPNYFINLQMDQFWRNRNL